jgi:nitric oxide reductase large subunit
LAVWRRYGHKKLWIAFAIVVIGSFAVPGGVGKQMIDQAPPIPSQVLTTDGCVLFDGATIQDGQNVWQSLGGQEIGSIWGRGSYVAPDWSADWLHRESVWASLEYGMWYARSAEFMQTGIMNTLRRLRVIGDTIFAIGAVLLGWFVLGLLTGHSFDRSAVVRAGESNLHEATEPALGG